MSKKETYYIVIVQGVEPDLRGPFKNGRERDNEARRVHALINDDDCVFWMNVKGCAPKIGSYGSAFFRIPFKCKK